MTTKTVLITGAAGQLGQAVAARFRQDGLRLILADRNEQALEQVFGERDNEILLPVDLLKRE
ncbi:SDR family NAD(P)-dependent oxidoreductase, partial [Comamonas kerstersii]